MPKIIKAIALQPYYIRKYVYDRQGFYTRYKAAARPDLLDLVLICYFFTRRQKQRLN